VMAAFLHRHRCIGIWRDWLVVRTVAVPEEPAAKATDAVVVHAAQVHVGHHSHCRRECEGVSHPSSMTTRERAGTTTFTGKPVPEFYFRTNNGEGGSQNRNSFKLTAFLPVSTHVGRRPLLRNPAALVL
jgi:hypothetical protein